MDVRAVADDRRRDRPIAWSRRGKLGGALAFARTADELGLTVPPDLIGRVDEVVE